MCLFCCRGSPHTEPSPLFQKYMLNKRTVSRRAGCTHPLLFGRALLSEPKFSPPIQIPGKFVLVVFLLALALRMLKACCPSPPIVTGHTCHERLICSSPQFPLHSSTHNSFSTFTYQFINISIHLSVNLLPI